MKYTLLPSAEKMNHNRKNKRWWQRAVRVMATAVVFCTTYALILPAITMEKETICGFEEHVHLESCYTPERPVYALDCGLEEQALVVHSHNELCVDDQGELICQLPELEVHAHGDECYTHNQTLVCENVHVHSDACAATELVLVCEQDEVEAHTHDESCVSTQMVQICGLEEVPAHTHGEDCYEIVVETCGLDEVEAHIHDESCIATETVLTCTTSEAPAHTHDEACYETVIETCGLSESQGHTHSGSCGSTETVLTCSDESEEHSHDDGCYETREVPCDQPESEGHTHDESCRTERTVLACGTAEGEGHTHGDGCYETREVSCGKPEGEGHTHDESCRTERTVLACGAVEGEGHTHGDACFEEREVPCELTEGEGHTHSDACYEEREIPCEQTTENGHVHDESCYEQYEEFTCTLDEIALHTHDESCCDEQNTLICELIQVIEHVHTEECLIQTGVKMPELDCSITEHIHDDSCYAEESLPLQYLCNSGAHTHVDECYDENGEEICNIPEHVHTAACVVEDLDLNADVENTQDWERELSKLSLTGNWPADVVAVAESQLDYTESVKNVVLENEELKGYTRYGEWYGDPYGDWNAMFASFVLNYAGVTDFPLNSDADAWVSELEEAELYAAADTYSPKPGDLIFFDYNWNRSEDDERPVRIDHVGLVAEVIPASEEQPAQIRTIEGDVRDMVVCKVYEMDEPAIMGYGIVPDGDVTAMTYEGGDFTVTVLFGQDANIPENAELAVEEILPGTAEYDDYYQQSVNALMEDIGPQVMALAAEDEEGETEEALKVSFARFFDISFLVDGQIIEPTATVNVEISYTEHVEQTVEDSGVAVHFTEEGVELLDATTSQNNEEGDVFTFAQDSFSVVGTMLFAVNRMAGITSATAVSFDSLKATSGMQYIIYTERNGSYYALTSKAGDVTGYAVPVSVNGNTVSWETYDPNMFWSFERNSGNSYYVQNYGTARYLHAFDNSSGTKVDYGTTTSGKNPSTLTRSDAGATFTAQGNSYYTGIYTSNGNITFNRINGSSQAVRFRLAAVGEFYNVWFDGTNGGMMSLYGSDDMNIPAIKNGSIATTITLPETWKSPTKYDYTLQGWYDINSHTYYPVDPTNDIEVTAEINADTVFYADWVAATYDVGENNSHVVDSVNTEDFITTHVFDYNALFNVQSLTHSGTISSGSHSEIWKIVNDGGTVPYSADETNTQGEPSLGFMFVDYDANGDFTYANDRDQDNVVLDINVNQGDKITPGILAEVQRESGKDLLDLLFNPDTAVIGKNYVGTGNYLFQYMDSTTENYDGEHDGYYYLDARLNAASYNKTDKRFYLYDYLERTSDSWKDGGVGQYSDFLPFNSPYIFDSTQEVDDYVDSIKTPGYEYDAKDSYSQNGIQYSEYGDATTNYFFGIRTDIEFFLPNDTNTTDEYGNYGNVSTRGEHMVFDFHGDDDVWVFVDGQLLLDIGGLHGVMFGQIDFSTGKVTVGKDGGTTETINFHMDEGTHTMTVYYMERGSSQSNCAIYFNIAPRYDLEITKEDIVTAELLDGAEFSIYTKELTEQMSETDKVAASAQLWDSFEAHEEDMEDGEVNDAKNTFTVVDGVAKCWGISAGKTYYIYETKPPEGYPESDDLIRITLNNRGTATIETTTLHGSNGIATEGFAVIKQEVNDTLKIVALTVTNQKDGDTTEVRVEKDWAAGSDNMPQSVTVYLTGDGVRIGREAVLSEENGWTYTWTGLPKYRTEGIDQEIEYEVEEVLVPNYVTTQLGSQTVDQYVSWNRVSQMSDSKTFLLVHNGQALTYNGSFGWMDPEEAKKDQNASRSAQWSVTTDHDGFHLKNGLGYALTFNRTSKNFYGAQSDAVELNQVFYYSNSRLMVHDQDIYYQFGPNGSSVSEDGLAFTLYQKDVFTGQLNEILNTPVDEASQTFVEVNKVWGDGADAHRSDSVIIRLLADTKDTGRYVRLSASNNWEGGFYDLPYYQANSTTVVNYTVVEDEVHNYIPQYSDGTQLPGVDVVAWREATAITAGETYRFVYSGYALAVDREGEVNAIAGDTSDENQLWLAENRSGTVILRNVGTQTYLAIDDGTNELSMTNRNGASAITVVKGDVKIGSKYLEVGAGYANGTNSSANISDQKTLYKFETTGMPGTGYTVTNIKGGPELPQTGGMGTHIYTFSGLLMILTAALMYMILGRKHRKGANSFRC